MRRVALLLLAGLWACQDDPPTRSRAEVREFRASHPCPSTGQIKGPCPGYNVDHIIPLCMGGADDSAQFQWLTIAEHKAKTRLDVRDCRAGRKLK